MTPIILNVEELSNYMSPSETWEFFLQTLVYLGKNLFIAGLISYFFFYKLVVKLAKASVYLNHERRGIKAKATNEEIATVIAVSAATVVAAQIVAEHAKKNGKN